MADRSSSPAGSAQPRDDRLGGDEAVGVWRAGERLLHPWGVEVLAVDRGAGLLPPRLLQVSGVDRVEPELVDEAHDLRARIG